jgi:hypothetical protein
MCTIGEMLDVFAIALKPAGEIVVKIIVEKILTKLAPALSGILPWGTAVTKIHPTKFLSAGRKLPDGGLVFRIPVFNCRRHNALLPENYKGRMEMTCPTCSHRYGPADPSVYLAGGHTGRGQTHRVTRRTRGRARRRTSPVPTRGIR